MLPHNADIIIIPKPALSYLSMKTLIEVHREGNYFVLKRAYFSNPDNNPGIFSSGGHAEERMHEAIQNAYPGPRTKTDYRSRNHIPLHALL
jgi:hypothetical protein